MPSSKSGNRRTARFWLRATVATALAILLLMLATRVASGQEGEGEQQAVHIVAANETLFGIAEQYGVEIDAILALNGLDQSDYLSIGQELIIPGVGNRLLPVSHLAGAGENLSSLAARYGRTAAEVALWNNGMRADRVAAGQSVALFSDLTEEEWVSLQGIPYLAKSGDTVHTIAAKFGISPLQLRQMNDLGEVDALIEDRRLRLPGEQPYQELPGAWLNVRVAPQPIEQGQSVVLFANRIDGLMPTGQLDGQTVRFTESEEGYFALVGLEAFATVGAHSLELRDGDGNDPLDQDFVVESGRFGVQYLTLSNEVAQLLDPQLVAAETALLADIYGVFSSEMHWDGLFQMPVTDTIMSAPYGDGRSYNGGPIGSFHSGVDLAGEEGLPITAPAVGTIVLAEALAVRGNGVIIDHGLGVMTGYYHMSEITVAVGDIVVAGQQIGRLGTTGLSTGPHLHWDLRVMNQRVNAMQWTESIFP